MELAADRLDGVPSGPDRMRARSLADHAGPLDLACTLNPRTVRTPALELLSRELEHAITTPASRLIVSMSPQEGKSTSLRMALLRKLQHHPERRNVIASYGLDLARTSGRALRQIVEANGSGVLDPATGLPLPDRLGISVAQDHAAAADWTLREHGGGVYCVGVGGGLTGRPIDGVLAIDDPIKDARDADSALIRGRLHDWQTAVAETRLAPEASVIVIATRWHEQDLSGWLAEQDQLLPPEEREWRVINIPAFADGRTLDALNRPAGEWMVSARGRTVAQWQRIRRRVGERDFNALYQGRPAPLEGGVFKREWFDRDRVPTRPADSLPPVVVVDPADNTGGGDEAGIGLVSAAADGRIFVGPDFSGHYTRARWVRLALLVLVRHDAASLAYERSLSGLAKSVQDGWNLIWKQARTLRRLDLGDCRGPVVDATLDAAVDELTHEDDPQDTVAETRRQLVELWPHVTKVLVLPSTGPRVRVIHAKGSKLLRAQAITSLYENRRVSHVGDMRVAESQMATWNEGQDSPDRMDWIVHGVSLMDGASPARIGRSTATIPTRSTGAGRSGGPASGRQPRSVRR